MKFGMRFLAGAAGLVALTACGETFDPDLRGMLRGGLDTAPAAARAAPRPAADARGVISFPGYQVAVARQGDTVATVAARLGLNAAELARHNAIDPSATLETGAVVALHRRVAAATPAAPATSATAGTAAPAPAAAPAGGVAGADAATPRQHVVERGETAWSIARKYGVSVADLASWNGLPASQTVRVGQRLMIPSAGAAAPAAGTETGIAAPGVGSATPRPPSAEKPLPDEKTQPASAPVEKPDAPDLGSTRTAASGGSRLAMPVSGSIIRAYEKGRNEGIDLSAPAGTAVKAAGAGTVAAITRDTQGTPIVVIRHGGDLMTVYAGLDNLTVQKGGTVTSGQTLGRSTSDGVVHFEVRRGFESQNPEDFL